LTNNPLSPCNKTAPAAGT
jgi:hypothetical protein